MTIKEISSLLKEKSGDKAIDQYLFNPETEVKELLTDSRNHFNAENTLFFAINTPGGNDGHRYIKELYQKGVRNFIIEYIPDDIKDLKDINFIQVADTVDALKEIGKSRRKNAREIVAITGSRGKTTIKEIIFQLMEPFRHISRSPRSYNSKIGVPLSLWQISPSTDIALIEAGVSGKGEMQRLREVISPDTVIFTNIGDAHSNGFSSLEEKAKEKALLAWGKNVKKIIYNADNNYFPDIFAHLPSDIQQIKWSVSKSDADLFVNYAPGILKWKWNGENNYEGKVEWFAQKEYDIENIAGTIAFMHSEEIPGEKIKESLQNYHPIGTRLNVLEGINGCSVILDSYTSDLSSLLPAIDFMARRKMPSQSLTLIISDLHFEGKNVKETYKEMAEIVRQTGVSRFIGIGEIICSFASFFPENSLFYPSTESFLNTIHASDFIDEIILLKGAPDFEFKKILDQLEAKKHETVLEVNLDALLRNYNYFRGKVPSSTGIIAMVKAFGYGAGSQEIAKTLQDAGASYLAVAALDEGIELRKNGITMPLMVMNPRSANYKTLFHYKLEPVIYSLSMLDDLIEEAEKYGLESYPIHLKLDTGMHRMGFEEKDLDNLIPFLKSGRIKVSTIFSHLATADCLDMDDFTIKQLGRFETYSSKIIKALHYNVKRHILNSAGIIRFPEYHYDFVRLGIGLYGANTLPPSIEKPLSVVSTLRSVIICIREIEDDETVGYGRKGKIGQKSRIATIPIGYADGMNRHFGNGAINVLINGQQAPTIGNICMDATMLDVTGIECKEGDSVEIFGENMSVQALADTLDTIPYEIFTSVSLRVKRVYYRE